MKKNTRTLRFLQLVSQFFVFFAVVAFVITCCTMLFVTTLKDALNIELTHDTVGTAAKLTLLNVALLSIIFTIVDRIRRKLTVDRPAEHITQAAERMMQGDFSTRIHLQHRYDTGEKFHEIAECFNRMAEELSHVETLRTDFIANVSHELKTPLAIIQNYASMLKSPALSEEERLEYAHFITDACRRLSSLVSNILKLNKLENQQIVPAFSTYDISEQVCECLLNFEDILEQKPIHVQTDLEESVNVLSDKEMMDLVFNNLFSNAIKFTEPKGTVSVSLSSTDAWATVSISDTGCGISKEVGAHIFDKFYQADTSHATQGNGLGLALVKRVIDITGNEIYVNSEPGHGSTFTVRIRRGYD